LDASLRQCSAALLEDGACIAIRHGGDSRTAAAALPEMVQDMLAEHGAGFDAVAVTVGPGSFTGLRSALAFAHGLALGGEVPVIGVTVAEALLAVSHDAAAWVALDARRTGRVFLGRDGDMAVVTLDALPLPSGPVRIVGDAADIVAAALCEAGADAVALGGQTVDPAAVGHVALRRLHGELPPCEPQPLYVGQPEARTAAVQRPSPV
jgi:tRNA threonylcarbamoyladenosine biosynthesis protein TsaB